MEYRPGNDEHYSRPTLTPAKKSEQYRNETFVSETDLEQEDGPRMHEQIGQTIKCFNPAEELKLDEDQRLRFKRWIDEHRLILTRSDTVGAARLFVAAKYLEDATDSLAHGMCRSGFRLLHYYRGDFYTYTELTGWQAKPLDDIRAEIYGFLNNAEVFKPEVKARDVAVFFEWEAAEYRKMAREDRLKSLKADQSEDEDETYLFLMDKVQPFRPKATDVNNIMDALRSVVSIKGDAELPLWHNTDTPHRHDRPKDFISFANGILDPDVMMQDFRHFYSPSPAYFSLNTIGFNYFGLAPVYDPITIRNWLSFLRDVFDQDHEAIQAFGEFVGLCMTGITDYQKSLLVIGPKRSGKGTIAKIMTELVGRGSVANPTLSALSSGFGLQPLIGKRLAIISDARIGTRSDQQAITERLLSITGEDSLTIDRKHREHWTGTLSTRFAIFSNELPRLTDVSGALASRFIVLKMTKSYYGKEDLTLFDRLKAELPHIAHWALFHLWQLSHRGHFIQPASGKKTIEDFETLSSPVEAFIRDRCKVDPDESVDRDLLYRNYQRWSQDAGFPASSKETFGRDLSAALPMLNTVQRTVDGQRKRSYVGLGVLDKTGPQLLTQSLQTAQKTCADPIQALENREVDGDEDDQ